MEEKNQNSDFEISYQIFYNLANTLFCITEQDGRIIRVNNEWSGVLGYSPAELTGKRMQDFVHPDDLPTTIDSYKSVLTGNRIVEFINRTRTKHSSFTWLEWRMELKGDYIYLAGRDFTEKKRQEQELESAISFASRIIHASPIGISTYDSTGLCKSCNSAYADIVGAPSLESMLSFNFHNIRSWKKSELYSMAIRVLNQGTEEHKEIHYLSSFGKQMWLDCYLTGFRMNDENHLLIIINDITAKKEIELALQENANELRESNAAKDKFFSIISHDLRSPFQGLLGYSKILHNEYDNLTDDDRKELIQSIDSLSINTYKLLENLLNWTRLQTGKMSVNPEALSIRTTCQSSLSLLQQIAKNKNIEINCEVSVKHLVKADLNMLETVIRNLISNAIKFTNEGGRINISSWEKDSQIFIAVQDSGIGMRPEDVRELFKIDTQLSRLGTAGEKGTGLGLLLCKEMIERCGGTIAVSSQLNSGSTFTFSLPKA